jgi:DNA-binding transcriptional MerR regulator
MEGFHSEADEPLMTPEELARLLGGDITMSTLSHWRNRGGGPDFIKAGHRVRYRPADVREWLKRKKKQQGTELAS